MADWLTRTKDTPEDALTLQDILQGYEDWFTMRDAPDVYQRQLAEREAMKRQIEEQKFREAEASRERLFRTGEREAGQEFTAEQAKLGREHEFGKLEKGQEYDIEKLGVGQKFTLAQMKEAQGHDLVKMEKSHEYRMAEIGKQETYADNRHRADYLLKTAFSIYANPESPEQARYWANTVFGKFKIPLPTGTLGAPGLPKNVTEAFSVIESIDPNKMSLHEKDLAKEEILQLAMDAAKTNQRYVNIALGDTLYQWDLVANTFEPKGGDIYGMAAKSSGTAKYESPEFRIKAVNSAVQAVSEVVDPKDEEFFSLSKYPTVTLKGQEVKYRAPDGSDKSVIMDGPKYIKYIFKKNGFDVDLSVVEVKKPTRVFHPFTSNKEYYDNPLNIKYKVKIAGYKDLHPTYGATQSSSVSIRTRQPAGSTAEDWRSLPLGTVFTVPGRDEPLIRTHTGVEVYNPAKYGQYAAGINAGPE